MTTTGPIHGNLLIHGGSSTGSFDQDTFDQLVLLAGGMGADIVYIPTAKQDVPSTNGEIFDFFGLNATVLHTRNSAEANLESFVSPIRNTNCVFIDGGRQPRLAESYLNTLTHHELQNLLDRGGAIAGTSAGAMIMSDFLVRGQGYPNIDDNQTIIGDHTEGFGFIKNIAFDVHVNKDRDTDLAEVLKVHPRLLGVGIDENTAILVQGNEFEVVGPGRVLIHDRANPVQTLRAGDRFDMRKRTPMRQQSETLGDSELPCY